MATKVKQCNCTGPAATFQDGLYGKNMRLHNERKEGKELKCTVCGSIKK